MMVTCSKDRSIAVWDNMISPNEINLRRVLVGHRAERTRRDQRKVHGDHLHVDRACWVVGCDLCLLEGANEAKQPHRQCYCHVDGLPDGLHACRAHDIVCGELNRSVVDHLSRRLRFGCLLDHV